MGWRWKVLCCPHCGEELRTRIICVEAEREIDRLKKEIDRLKGLGLPDAGDGDILPAMRDDNYLRGRWKVEAWFGLGDHQAPHRPVSHYTRTQVGL